ncbi:MAG: carbohydrate ABC transporter permease [Clostridia bacterium]|nr:carbohydrate ABC transporter permease [Clostridia bacterium]
MEAKRNTLRSEKFSLGLSRGASYVLLIFMTFLCLFPFYMLIICATKQSGAISSAFTFVPGHSFMYNARNLLNDANIPVVRGIFNSLLVATGAAGCATYFSAMSAYGLYAYQFKMRRFAKVFILMVMMVPTQVSTLGLIELCTKLGMMDTYWPLILPKIAAPIVYFYIIQYMESVLPLEIVEAARCDGASEFRTFNTIVLPVMKPAIAVQAIFTFVESWNCYFLPTLIINTNAKKTIPILIAQLRTADYLKFDLGKVYMMICVAIVPVVIVYLLLSKFIIKGVTMGSVKG